MFVRSGLVQAIVDYCPIPSQSIALNGVRVWSFVRLLQCTSCYAAESGLHLELISAGQNLQPTPSTPFDNRKHP